MTLANRLMFFDPDLRYTTKCFRGVHESRDGGCKGNWGLCDCDCHKRYK
jgi:hypothetical protein